MVVKCEEPTSTRLQQRILNVLIFNWKIQCKIEIIPLADKGFCLKSCRHTASQPHTGHMAISAKAKPHFGNEWQQLATHIPPPFLPFGCPQNLCQGV